MKRFLLLTLVLLLLVPSLFSCGEARESRDTVTVVTTVFPEYDWVRQILGNENADVELILLTQNGTDLHSYQPTVSDIATVSECDVLIYSGGASAAWIEDALNLKPDDDRVVIRLMDLLSEAEKLTEQSLHHNVGHDQDECHEHAHSHEYDEHVWLSLQLAAKFSAAVCEILCEKLPQNEVTYRENLAAYCDALFMLDGEYRALVTAQESSTLLFADRFPFSYLMRDYGVDCYAAFPGCSSETEASFKTVAFLAEQIDSLSLPSVVVLENTDTRLAETVIASTVNKNAVIVTMDSMQSISAADIEQGVTYLDIMKNNLEALRVALTGLHEE